MSTTMMLVIGTLIVSIVSVAAFLLRRSRAPDDGSLYYMRCPSCRSKIRYHARQVGHRGMCNSCKERFTFPSIT